MIRQYYQLTKPGIIRGNLLTAAAGFLLAASGKVDLGLLLATLLGIALVIASACTFNNYIDRGIDRQMARTKARALARGQISSRAALLYASALGLAGFGLLSAFTNPLTVIIGLIGYLDYLALYGLSKRRAPYGTLVGSISGAVPPVAGYTAVTASFDTAALLLFLILVCWQMPHFYAIAMYRLDEYRAADLPVLPAVRGLRRTKLQILAYVLAFGPIAASLTIFGYTGLGYLIVATILSLGWLRLGLRGWRLKDDQQWARQMFLFSLVVISLLSVAISVDSFWA